MARQAGPFTWLDIANPKVGELQAAATQYNLPDALVRDYLEAHVPAQF
ncbi:hypothetical protein GCM10011495_09170 [Hymenobacter frigidus]|uniref:Uncharacterized protein n=1 Tax=Hymenobacter frigidus TaxID=1524095 RepID=A0ABQ1ZXI0_9BACT|nr:hypothetical protein [Hymenobacter frigidus]GGH81843.1 hypothetical protein GCM10011495_09170 [Hymenobacter frigidus]